MTADDRDPSRPVEGRFEAPDGVGLAYYTWGAAERGLPPVVLHHGFAADARLNWVLTGVVPALQAAGRHVVAIDARGHGRSDKPHDPALYGEPTMARDLIALFDLLDAPSFDLVGYSMGAVVSALTAAQEPRIERLVLGGVGAAMVELGGLDTGAASNEAIAAVLRADDPARVSDPAVLGFRQLADAIGADRLALAAQADSVHKGRIALERIGARTLVIVGDQDPLGRRPQVLVEAIEGASLREVSGDHMAAVADPAFASAIVEFLSRPA